MVFKFEKALRPSGCHNASEQTTAYMTGRTANCFEPKRGEVIARVCALRRVFAREHHRATQNTTPRLLLYLFSPSLATPSYPVYTRTLTVCCSLLTEFAVSRCEGKARNRTVNIHVYDPKVNQSKNSKKNLAILSDQSPSKKLVLALALRRWRRFERV